MPAVRAEQPAQPAGQEMEATPPALDMTFDPGPGAPAGADAAPAEASFWRQLRPTRVTIAQESAYKFADPQRTIKERASVRVEYSRHFLEHSFLQFDAKRTQFFGADHRHFEGSDTRVNQAYVQTSLGQTSVGVGIQTVAWGESILAPITDEVSPRDNRELFNFNLEELRVGQPMVTVDQYSDLGRFSAFYTPHPRFNKIPRAGSAYFLLPAGVTIEQSAQAQASHPEYGLNWRRSFGRTDVSLMAARLTDNDFALRAAGADRLVAEPTRFSLFGMTVGRVVDKFLLKGELGLKMPKAFNDAQQQIVRRNELDAYLGVEYRHSSTLSLGLEAVNQHIVNWDPTIQTARDRQTILLTATQLLRHDDLSIQLLQFFNRPDASRLTMVMTSLKWNDNLTFGLNLMVPSTRHPRSSLYGVRDQKQVEFKMQYQF